MSTAHLQEWLEDEGHTVCANCGMCIFGEEGQLCQTCLQYKPLIDAIKLLADAVTRLRGQGEEKKP